ncbi:MAG: hypothetical protein WKF78_09635 [Candidatus Limnocylindrales bacterium]
MTLALRALVLVDGSSDDAGSERLRQAVRDIEAGEPGGTSVLSGDRAALAELEARSRGGRPVMDATVPRRRCVQIRPDGGRALPVHGRRPPGLGPDVGGFL